MAEHTIYQSEILGLLEQAGFDPETEDVHSLHIEYANVWAEVFVRDEKGLTQFTTDKDGNMRVVTTVVPIKWVGQFHDEAELQ